MYKLEAVVMFVKKGFLEFQGCGNKLSKLVSQVVTYIIIDWFHWSSFRQKLISVLVPFLYSLTYE